MTEEKRRQRRELITVPVNYSYVSGEPEASATSGITLNLSDTGMCFYTHMPLAEGAPLKVSSTAIWEEPRPAVVKWCRRITEELYRVGIFLV
jgi:hypothetical protein